MRLALVLIFISLQSICAAQQDSVWIKISREDYNNMSLAPQQNLISVLDLLSKTLGFIQPSQPSDPVRIAKGKEREFRLFLQLVEKYDQGIITKDEREKWLKRILN